MVSDDDDFDIDPDDDISFDNEDADGLGGDEDERSDSSSSDDSSDSSGTAGITPTLMAKNALRKANKQENTGSITLVGDPTLVSGVTVNLKNFGAFDKKYIVSKAVHRISGGYTIDVDIRKCLNGY